MADMYNNLLYRSEEPESLGNTDIEEWNNTPSFETANKVACPVEVLTIMLVACKPNGKWCRLSVRSYIRRHSSSKRQSENTSHGVDTCVLVKCCDVTSVVMQACGLKYLVLVWVVICGGILGDLTAAASGTQGQHRTTYGGACSLGHSSCDVPTILFSLDSVGQRVQTR
uniref:Uncharacterized protein n=1 Tax=Timema cristinae TaxID=61476 RepID=A0A7R9DAU5_TIMCR|nr:unnamed protein product [Timema cristinae]